MPGAARRSSAPPATAGGAAVINDDDADFDQDDAGDDDHPVTRARTADAATDGFMFALTMEVQNKIPR